MIELRSGKSRLGRTWLIPVAALALVLVVAALFRLWHIQSVPPGLFGDEATDGLDALDVLAGRGAVFFPANFGREGLHMWILAGFFRLLGVSALALRLPSVIAGILTAPATFWLGLELSASGLFAPLAQVGDGASAQAGPAVDHHVRRFRPAVWLGLLAALYLSTSYFHVHFSRFGIRGVFTPLCAALAFAAFWRGVNLGGRRTYAWFALSGLFLGLGMHFYTASRFLPIFLAGFLLLQALVALVTRRRDEAILIRHFGAVALLFAVALLVFAPLAVYFLQHPGSFSQRASAVSAFNEGSPLARMGQAALANVLQFFVPGMGDEAQFYNLPGRAVFDPLTALLALVGMAALLYRWRRPAALFLLTWWPALLLPSFLATDRFPTLPRVLGTIPGVYFFPAAGLLVLAMAASRLLPGQSRTAVALSSGGAAEPAAVRDNPEPAATVVAQQQDARFSARPGPAAWLPVALVVLALCVHAGLTYRDYFLVWGQSTATFDAFEGDMAQAAGWMAGNLPAGHVYLSSDIYRHPTFMLLHEHATVTEYFVHRNPGLSWFDARSVLPLPPRNEPATYVLTSSAPPADSAAAFLSAVTSVQAREALPDSSAVLTVTVMPETAADIAADRAPEPFSDRLALIGATWGGSTAADPVLWLYWQTSGPDPAAWPGYRLQLAGDGWQAELPFDDFRPPEWVPGGRFLTWRSLDLPDEAQELPSQVRMRLVAAYSEQPVTAGTGDGWHTVQVNPR